jgi:glycosyltransferase involved in cell wall biosynthesis
MKTVIVIPCYNEADRLDLQSFVQFSKKHSNIDLCFVDDGSTDSTLKVLEELRASLDESRVSIVTLKNNMGKGEAVRQGVLSAHATGSYEVIAYWDADLATPLEECLGMIERLKTNDFDVILGVRIGLCGWDIQRKMSRHYVGRIACTVVDLFFHFGIYDTQCGAKCFRADLISDLCKTPFISHWLFDIELLNRYRLKAPQAFKVYEYPITRWKDVEASKLKVTDLLMSGIDLIKIWIFSKRKT